MLQNVFKNVINVRESGRGESPLQHRILLQGDQRPVQCGTQACSLPESNKACEELQNDGRAYCRGSVCSAKGAGASAVAWGCELPCLNTDSALGRAFARTALRCTLSNPASASKHQWRSLKML